MGNRIVYLNGAWLNEADAKVSIFDRGFLMADAVYEVTAVLDGKLIDFDPHVARLNRSLGELKMSVPLSRDEFLSIHRELVVKNCIVDGAVYLQVTRGSPDDRDFVFPDPKKTPQTVLLFTQAKSDLRNAPTSKKGIKVISLPDLRWGRCDIKTVQLLYPSLAKMEAVNAGKDDAWLVKDGFVTEASAANAYIVKGKTIISHPLTNSVLHGITRASLLAFIARSDFTLEQRKFSLEEAKTADECIITSATNFVCPVVEIDGVTISGGQPGPVAVKLRDIYFEECTKRAI